MKILIISDTHGRHGNLCDVLEKESHLDMLIHLGDLEDAYYIEEIVNMPNHMLSGNNDFFSHLPNEKEIVIGTYKVFMTHGHGYHVTTGIGRLVEEARKRHADIVMFGHTHKPHYETVENITIINPGSLSYPRQQGRCPSYAIMEIDKGGKATFEVKFL